MAEDDQTEDQQALAPVTEYEVLDLLYEALPGDQEGLGASLYAARDNLPRPEFYVRLRGECWRVLAVPHPHPLEEAAEEVAEETYRD